MRCEGAIYRVTGIKDAGDLFFFEEEDAKWVAKKTGGRCEEVAVFEDRHDWERDSYRKSGLAKLSAEERSALGV
jgi:hypothetical protein